MQFYAFEGNIVLGTSDTSTVIYVVPTYFALNFYLTCKNSVSMSHILAHLG